MVRINNETNLGIYVCSRVHLTGVHNRNEEGVCRSPNPDNDMGVISVMDNNGFRHTDWAPKSSYIPSNQGTFEAKSV